MQQKPIRSDIEIYSILGVNVHAISSQQLLTIMRQVILDHRRITIAYMNIHGMNIAYKVEWFRGFFNQCDLVFCDGFGVKWGAELLGYSLPERFTPPDWIDQLAALAYRHGFSLFLLGSRPGVAEKTATVLERQFPKLKIVGTQHGYFDKTLGSVENEAIIEHINRVKPNILIIGFGMPLQERWLLENRHRLDVNVVLTGGAVLDYVSGTMPRGPRWMTDHGLEWLSRLMIEPWRLWQRYIIGNPLFLWRVLQQRFGLSSKFPKPYPAQPTEQPKQE